MQKCLIVLGFALAACGGSSEVDLNSDESDLSSARNEDVQVIEVSNGESFSLSKGSVYPAIDQEKCKPEGITWDAIKAHDPDTDGDLRVVLDCTEAVSEKYGLPSMRAVKVEGYRTKKGEQDSYGYIGFTNGGGSFWMKTVELVVKKSAIDKSSFNGIGFYLNEFTFRYYEAPPGPGDNNGNGYFVFAEAVRAQAAESPTKTLRAGQEARVVKVLLPSAYALGGTSSVPGFYFRPFAEYVRGSSKRQRWDSVASDYFVTTNTVFNRSGDVLAP